MVTHGNLFKKVAGVALVLCLLLSLAPTGTASSGYIEVGTIPVPDFSGTPLRGKAPLDVQFTDNSSGAKQNMTYKWDFGDGNTSTATNPKHTYTKEGNYTVTLTLTNDYGTKSATKTNYVYVGSGPVADFTANNTAGKSPLSVKFTDASSGNPTKYLWNFGDGTTSSEKSPTHVYNQTGTYNVSLTVTNDFGTDTKTSNSLVNVGVAPYVFFTANGTVNSKQVVFTTHGDTSGTAGNYSWNFGDGKTSTEKNPTHTYASAGTYNVTLNVTNSYGTSTYTLRNVSITDALKADFNATNNLGSAPLNVKFNDLTVGSGGNSTYLWNFGDGTTSADRNPSHSYNRSGQYTVTLTVTNPCGATDSIVKTSYVSVGYVPVADFTGTPTSGVAPLNVQFTDNSQGSDLTYAWDFGDGSTSTTKSPSHIYNASGTYTVKLTVSNSYGNNTVTKTNYITVGNVPRANFSADVLSGIAPHPVQFTDLSTGSPTSWSWDFGDGGTSTEKNPRHTYQYSGYYNVTLTVKNAYGESSLYRLGDGQEVWAEDQNKTNTTETVEEEETAPVTNETEEEPPKSAIPGFSFVLVIAAIFCLAGVGALYKKRK